MKLDDTTGPQRTPERWSNGKKKNGTLFCSFASLLSPLLLHVHIEKQMYNRNVRERSCHATPVLLIYHKFFMQKKNVSSRFTAKDTQSWKREGVKSVSIRTAKDRQGGKFFRKRKV